MDDVAIGGMIFGAIGLIIFLIIMRNEEKKQKELEGKISNLSSQKHDLINIILFLIDNCPSGELDSLTEIKKEIYNLVMDRESRTDEERTEMYTNISNKIFNFGKWRNKLVVKVKL